MIATRHEYLIKPEERIGYFTSKWEKMIRAQEFDEMVETSSIKFMERKGFKVFEIHPEVTSCKNNKQKTYGPFLVCEKKDGEPEKIILLVSAKTKVSLRDVRELLVGMKDFFFFLDQYRGYKLMGAIAGESFVKGADLYALRSGIIVMKTAGEVMQIQEPKKIRFIR
jgi:hypothetical protein